MSVGHLARLLEAAGIAAVVVGIRAFRHRLEAMRVPRLVVTRDLLGRTLGPPGDRERQRAVIRAALDLLENASQGGTVVELPEHFHPTG